MRAFITTILTFITLLGVAQTILTPGKNSFEKKWMRQDTYQMTWFAMKDTTKFELGEVSTKVLTNKKYITIVTVVNMKNSKGTWVDTTIASISTLAPVRHASYNPQRNMVLNFGNIITGFYKDKIKQQSYTISDTTTKEYFDSNLYPVLITWLPLKKEYKQDISIYDYNPSGKIGVITAYVKSVTNGIYQSVLSGTRDVWLVTVADEIGNNKDNFIIYYIDKKDRKLWKQEINATGRKMIMQRKEL